MLGMFSFLVLWLWASFLKKTGIYRVCMWDMLQFQSVCLPVWAQGAGPVTVIPVLCLCWGCTWSLRVYRKTLLQHQCGEQRLYLTCSFFFCKWLSDTKKSPDIFLSESNFSLKRLLGSERWLEPVCCRGLRSLKPNGLIHIRSLFFCAWCRLGVKIVDPWKWPQRRADSFSVIVQ